ncbi:MAG: Hpt domain-containing protein [Xanthomonadales bacterium]|nr:Hpt domain-containing protein [Xanthomonadales bacterium]
MDNLSERARELLEKQRHRYLTSLPEKKASLQEAWHEAAGGHVSELLERIHKLAGSSGLHGLDVIQGLAVEIEEAIKGQASREEYADRFDALLAAIDLESPD